jgi:hypothetical protein
VYSSTLDYLLPVKLPLIPIKKEQGNPELILDMEAQKSPCPYWESKHGSLTYVKTPGLKLSRNSPSNKHQKFFIRTVFTSNTVCSNSLCFLPEVPTVLSLKIMPYLWEAHRT